LLFCFTRDADDGKMYNYKFYTLAAIMQGAAEVIAYGAVVKFVD
jgi:hypothetical protein